MIAEINYYVRSMALQVGTDGFKSTEISVDIVDEKLQIVEIIIGARCVVPRTTITEALGTSASTVKIMKARAAYDKFQMVEDED